MTQSWDENSEVVFGLLMKGRVSPNAVRSEVFKQPYSDLVAHIKRKPEWEMGELITINYAAVQTALSAVENLNGLGDVVDWASLLERTYVMHEVSSKLERASKELSRGKDIDAANLIESLSRLSSNKGTLVRMSTVEPEKIKFVKTGWAPIDYHLGGIPEVGLITLAAPPKTGKTSSLIKLANKFVNKHKTKQVAIFTAEMMIKEFVARCYEIEKDWTWEARQRILLCDEILSVGEIAAKVATLDNVGLIGIDFADLLVDGPVDSSAMENIYRVLAKLAKNMRVPVVLLAQLSGNYDGGLPRPHYLRWTRLAEALSYMVLMLYAPTRDYHSDRDKGKSADEKLLPAVPGKAYILAWLSRGGFRVHGGPGAIQLPWLGELAWSDNRGKWFNLEKSSEDDEDEEE